MFGKISKIFNLRKIEKEVFEILFESETMSASDIAKQVGISRTAIYDIVKKLIDMGLAYETLDGSVKMFGVQSVDKLKLLLAEKESEINSAIKNLRILEKNHIKSNKNIKPHIQVFTNKDSLKQMMKDMLLYDDATVYAYWPIKKVIELLGADFLAEFHQKRIKYGIKLKTIWPQNQIPELEKYPFLKTGSEFLREIRLAPKDVNFTLGYAIYNNTVRFVSSKKEGFGFLIESKELSETMKSQFKLIWDISKPYDN